MPIFLRFRIAALVLVGLYLPTAHLAPEKLVTMTRQIPSRRRDRLLLRPLSPDSLRQGRRVASVPAIAVTRDCRLPIPLPLAANGHCCVWLGPPGRTVGLLGGVGGSRL